jgi:hypothetical protein
MDVLSVGECALATALAVIPAGECVASSHDQRQEVVDAGGERNAPVQIAM